MFTKVIRSAAGFNERHCIVREALGLYGTVVLAVTYTLPLPCTTPLRSLLVHALKQCISEHAMLTAICVDVDGERPKIAQVSEIDIRNHLSVLDDVQAASDYETAVQALLHKVHNDELEFTKHPAWRLYAKALPSEPVGYLKFVAAFSFSHILADGTSGMIFHRTLLSALQEWNGVSADDEAVFKTPQHARLLPPALDRAADFPISWAFLIPPFVNEFFPKWLVRRLGLDSEDKEVWTGAATRPALPAAGKLLSTSLLFQQVPQSDVQRVLVTCRKFGARLTGLLAVLISQSLAKALKARGQESSKFSTLLPIDLRRCMPGNDDMMANYPSGIQEKVLVQNDLDSKSPANMMSEEDWNTARRITENLTSKSATRKDQLMSLLKYIGNFHDWILKEASKPSETSFELSNVGVFNPIPRAKASELAQRRSEVEDVIFSQSALATGATLMVNVGSAMGGPLSITVTWWPGMLGVGNEDVFVQKVLGDVVHRLKSIQ